MSHTMLSIVFTINMLLSIYHPFIPWLVIQQSDQSTIRIGHRLAFDRILGPSFQERPLYGHINYISHYVKGFVIIVVAKDPQVFPSAIYLAIPRSWIALSPLSSIIYLLSYHSLPKPSFTWYMKPSHPLYDNLGSPGGSRLSRNCR
ncbi:hypothetical protein BYT27DRAFT_7193107 [Phlegmacium glaucopus]|nr:hypothetical protein BYT27DRAFT_7193107 [Phlegmacium glaucopus]